MGTDLRQGRAGQRLRTVIIGVGAGVFSMHRPALEAQAGLDVVGVCDVNVRLGRERAAELGAAFFPDHRALLDDVRPDLAVILTPHPLHAPIAVDCFAAGCHVLVEKPLAVHVGEADTMLAAAERAGRLLAVNFQHRHRPAVRAARRLIAEGRLGTLQRVELVAIWTRTACYYELGAWRGTWAGEGGGVLMNQAPHQLDLVCYLLGAPRRVVGWTRTRLHRIETEDTAAGLVEWPSGALGVLYTSTAEAGEPERIQIAGTRGILTIRQSELEFQAAETDLQTFIAESTEPFGKFSLQPASVTVEPGDSGHTAVYANLLAAISGAEPLMADGRAARQSLELANALIYSGQTGRQVELPLDPAAYAELLASLRARGSRQS